jgi:hypothetical protein
MKGPSSLRASVLASHIVLESSHAGILKSFFNVSYLLIGESPVPLHEYSSHVATTLPPKFTCCDYQHGHTPCTFAVMSCNDSFFPAACMYEDAKCPVKKHTCLQQVLPTFFPSIPLMRPYLFCDSSCFILGTSIYRSCVAPFSPQALTGLLASLLASGVGFLEELCFGLDGKSIVSRDAVAA